MKPLLIPLTVLMAFLPPIFAWAVVTEELCKRWGTWMVFVTSSVMVLTYVCIIRTVDGIRAERKAFLKRNEGK